MNTSNCVVVEAVRLEVMWCFFKYGVLLFGSNVVIFCIVTHVHICIDVMEEPELLDSH